MFVRDVMSPLGLVLGPTHTLRRAAGLMSARGVGAAVVLDPDTGGIGLLTEGDILRSLGRGQDPDRETVQAHLTTEVSLVPPDWTLRRAAAALTGSRGRHLVVVDGREPVGLVSLHDLGRCWVSPPADGRWPSTPTDGRPPRPRSPVRPVGPGGPVAGGTPWG